MASHNNNSAQIQAYKDYQDISECKEEALEEFYNWMDEEWDWSSPILPLPQNQEELVVCLKQALDQFLMRDEKSQALIKAGEQELLKRWSK